MGCPDTREHITGHLRTEGSATFQHHFQASRLNMQWGYPSFDAANFGSCVTGTNTKVRDEVEEKRPRRWKGQVAFLPVGDSGDGVINLRQLIGCFARGMQSPLKLRRNFSSDDNLSRKCHWQFNLFTDPRSLSLSDSDLSFTSILVLCCISANSLALP